MRVESSSISSYRVVALCVIGQSALHSNFMTLIEKIREYAESNRPFRLHLSDTRILEVKGRDWISTHPSRAVTSVSIGDNFRSRWESRSRTARPVGPGPTSSRKRYETGANNQSDLQHLSQRLSREISDLIVTKNEFYLLK
jgi:hypothetical protein